MDSILLHLTLNGNTVSVRTSPVRRLIDLLRDDLGLAGTKEGCGEGECGACSVLLDGRLANSCIIAVGAIEGADLLTIEGFRDTPRHAALSAAFEDAGAVQCGFCTPGMLLAAEALLRRNSNPTSEEIRVALSGNLCRCTGYGMIVNAVLLAAERGAGLW